MASPSEDFDEYEQQAGTGSNISRKTILCTRMIKLHPNRSDIYLTWALQLLKRRKYQKAKQKFQRAIRISPNMPILYSEWVEALYFERQFSEIILILEKDLEKFTIPENVHNLMGICFLQLGEYENAIKCFEKVTVEKMDYEMVHFYWAVALYLQGEKEEALQVFENRGVKEIYDLHLSIFDREIGWLKEDLKREEWKEFGGLTNRKIEGFEYVLELMIENAGPDARLVRMTNPSKDCFAYEEQVDFCSDMSRAIVFHSRIMKLCPNHADLYLEWAIQLLKQKQCQKARQKWKRSIQISSNDADLYYEWLKALLRERQFKEMVLVLEKYSEKFPSPSFVQGALGLSFLHIGDYEKSTKCFGNVAIEKKREEDLMYFYWTAALYLEGQEEEALQLFVNRFANEIDADHIFAVEREIYYLKKDLEREDWKEFEDLVNIKIKGFQYVLGLMRKIPNKAEERFSKDHFERELSLNKEKTS